MRGMWTSTHLRLRNWWRELWLFPKCAIPEVKFRPMRHPSIRRTDAITTTISGASYTLGKNRIELGNVRNLTIPMLVFIVKHETLHHLLYHIMGEETTEALDRMEPRIDVPWVNGI